MYINTTTFWKKSNNFNDAHVKKKKKKEVLNGNCHFFFVYLSVSSVIIQRPVCSIEERVVVRKTPLKMKYLNQRKRGSARERTIWSNQGRAYDKEESQEAKAKSKRRTIPQVRRDVGVHKGTVVRPEKPHPLITCYVREVLEDIIEWQ